MSAPMSRQTRQWVQLGAVLVIVAVLVAAYLLVRSGGASPGSSESGVRTGTTAARTATVSASRTATVSASRTATVSASRTATASASRDPVSGLRWVEESTLPAEARQTLGLIRAGGPYPYPRNDDQVFGNREGLLPKKASGYYREYTVLTPGSGDRGARRIVKGSAGELYYTVDHYQSFRRIQEGT